MKYSQKISIICICLILAILMLFISVYQIFGTSPDYGQYEDFFNLARFDGVEVLSTSRFEIGFSALSILLTALIASNLLIYSLIVGISMFMKGMVIRISSSNMSIFLILYVFYFMRFFSLQELTQLRLACAAAILMMGYLFILRDSRYRGAIICSFSALFHLSSLLVIPALFLPIKKLWHTLFIVVIIFILTNIFIEFTTKYLAQYIQIVDSYQENGFHEIKPNPFSIQLLIDWGMIVSALFMWTRLTLLMKRIIFIELIGMAFFYGAIDYGIIAHRIREFYSVFWVFFIADGLRLKSTKLLCYLFIFVNIFFYGYIFFINGNFFQ
jgi:hypothetical protein